MLRHFTQDFDLTPQEQAQVLALAERPKAERSAFGQALAGRCLGMLFDKSSTRTRVSLEAGMHQLGGHAIFLHARDNQLGRGESLADTAKVLSRYVDVLSIRTFAHATVQTLAAHSRVPRHQCPRRPVAPVSGVGRPDEPQGVPKSPFRPTAGLPGR